MSIAIQNGILPNLVTLYLKGHLQKSHVINYNRTSVKNRKKVEIDISDIDFSHGYTVADIPTSMETTSSKKTEDYVWETVATTINSTSLQGDPTADLRIQNNTTTTEQELNDTNEFKSISNVNGSMNMNSFKDYRE